MSNPTPAEVSASGELLWIEHPIGGDRPMAHVFMVDGGGIAYADHGWSDGLSGRHPFHVVLGEVRPRGEGTWHLTPTQEHLVRQAFGEPIVIRLPATEDEAGTPDGDREHAREVLVQWLALDGTKLSTD